MRRWIQVLSLTLIILLAIALVHYSFTSIEVLDEVPLIKKEPGTKLVGLISDTHIPSRARMLPDKVFEVFKDVDMIIHAGDLTEIEVVEELRKIAPVLAVHGNMDTDGVRAELPEIINTELYGWKIGIVHDPGALWGIGNMKKIAKENELNVLVFGHSHRQFLKWEDDVLFINPGSPTNPLPPIFVKPTVGLLLISEDGIKPFIIGL